MTQNYETLNNDVRVAREGLKIAEEKITAHQEMMDLFGSVSIMACKNIFKKVLVNASVEDGPFTVNCDCFRENEVCCNNKCPHFADNFDYMAALDKLASAKSKLYAFQKDGRTEVVR